MKSLHGDINKLVEGGDVNPMVGEVWNDSEGGDWVVEDRTIEFHNDVL